jgi:antitoxin component YwqK of YwqJK toxin-antitoxin module
MWVPEGTCPEGTVRREQTRQVPALKTTARDVWCERPDGIKQGPFQSYTDGGTRLLSESYYVGGKKDGDELAIERDGNIAARSRFVQNERVVAEAPPDAVACPSGTTERESVNRQAGRREQWCEKPNGTVDVHREYYDGQKHGDWTVYKADGSALEIERFDHGVRTYKKRFPGGGNDGFEWWYDDKGHPHESEAEAKAASGVSGP